ncbi:MAG: 4-hydroxy-3-methylbut-2-enyl diphosphate reductase [Bacilli bacterium]|nr:4-hydroxy-3-methylbut-2-enyl diphosphate reductase [Bacilli bacterium]
MKVTILEPQGYCAGVTNAINIALRAKLENQDKDVYILGMLVHNQKVINELTSAGITTLYRDGKTDEELLYSIPDDSIVVFSAHGHKKNLDEIAKNKRFKVYDATCPKVLNNLNLIDREIKEGNKVIYIGHKNHPEALAALSRSENVLFYDIKGEFNYQLLKDKKPLVINQTTLNTKDLKEIYIDIIVHLPKARILDEICPATRLRQEALISLESDVDLILVIGDKNSSNTNRLVEIAKANHPNIPSYLISDIEELKNIEINKKKHVAIASGASTPKKEIDKIKEYLKNLDN